MRAASRAMAVATALALALAPTAGCGRAGPDATIDAPPRDPPPPCAARDLELGRCQRDDGAPCTGALDEVRRFAPLAEGGPITVVTGPQGAWMLVFSARTAGIVAGDPGDPVDPDNPLVELVVSRAGAEVALYRGRVGFAAAGDQVEASGLFVITEDTSLVGQALVAHGRLTDVAGALRCGEVGFTAAR